MAIETSVRNKVTSEVHKKPPLSPRTKKSASDLKEERRRLVKSEPRRRKRNGRESDRKKKHDRKRAPRLDLDNSTLVDADDFGAEYLTVSMKPVRMTSRSGKMKSPLGNINVQRSRKLPFQNCLWCIRKLPNYHQFIVHAKEIHPKQVAGLLNNDDFE